MEEEGYAGPGLDDGVHLPAMLGYGEVEDVWSGANGKRSSA